MICIKLKYLNAHFRNNRVHPQSCRCRGCLKKKREQKVRQEQFYIHFYFMFFLILAFA